jgi:hypothetical protein
MDSIEWDRSKQQDMTDPVCGEEALFPLGMVCDDGEVVERVSLGGLEVVAIEFR